MTRHDEHAHRACLARLADALQHLAAARAMLAEPLSVIAAEQRLDDWQEHLDALESGARGAQHDVGLVIASAGHMPRLHPEIAQGSAP